MPGSAQGRLWRAPALVMFLEDGPEAGLPGVLILLLPLPGCVMWACHLIPLSLFPYR